MDRGYGHMLHWSLRHRLVMLLIAVAVTASVVLVYPRIGQELAIHALAIGRNKVNFIHNDQVKGVQVTGPFVD